MNKDDAKDYLPLVQALADGKDLQIKTNRGWSSNLGDCFKFDSDPECYRIKPESRTFEMWLTPKGFMYPVKDGPTVTPDMERITVQEVLP